MSAKARSVRSRVLVTLVGAAMLGVPSLASPNPTRAADPVRFLTYGVDVLSGSRYHRSWQHPTDFVRATGSDVGVEISGENDQQERGRVDFYPPIGGTLQPGVFQVTSGTPTETSGALRVTNGSSDCVALGTFEILEAPVYDAANVITAFAASFEANCGNNQFTGVAAVDPTVAVKAVAVDPQVALQFGRQAIGSPSDAQAVTVRNIGNAPVQITGVTVGGTRPDSYLASADCTTVPAGGTCAVQVRFRAAGDGPQFAWVDVTTDDARLPRRVDLWGEGVLVEVTNTTPATAQVIDELPFVHGGLVPADAFANACGTSGRSLWYRYTTPVMRRISFYSSYSSSAPELFKGTASALTKIQCGSAPQSLDFTALPGITYWIKVVTQYPAEDRGIVRVAEGPADDGVQVRSVRITPSTFYPYRDNYLDTVSVRGTRDEPISVAVRVYSSTGSIVRYLTLPSGVGVFDIKWNGRRASGTTLPAGRYRFLVYLTDEWGNRQASTFYATLSWKRLYVYTYTKTLNAADYRASGTAGTGRISKSGSRYAGGLRLTSGSSGAAGVAYNFSLPAATVYRTVRFYVLGVGQVPPVDIGLQQWSVCTGYNTGCVDPWSGGPIAYGWAEVRGGARNVSGGRLVRGYIQTATYGGYARTVDVRDVKIVASYGILR